MKHITLLFLLSLFSCESSSQKMEPKAITPQTNTMEKNDKELSYLALGDSYTIGQSVAEADRWPIQLAKSLTSSGLSVSPPEIIARTGWTTDELKANIVSQNITKTYSLVSLLIGVNNQYRGRSVEQFREEFIDLLRTAIKFSGNHPDHVFVVSIPDWGVTPYGGSGQNKTISQQIDSYNAVVKEETVRRGILYFDITPISREAINDPSLIAGDGLHPSGKMYQLWTEKIAPELLKQLKP